MTVSTTTRPGLSSFLPSRLFGVGLITGLAIGVVALLFVA